jgi:predicted nuclease with TOPRIM domain
MSDLSDDLRDQLARYQALVLDYEALDERIDELLDAYGGNVDQMSGKDKQTYRELHRRRDELQNDMRMMEHSLNIDPDDVL